MIYQNTNPLHFLKWVGLFLILFFNITFTQAQATQTDINIHSISKQDIVDIEDVYCIRKAEETLHIDQSRNPYNTRLYTGNIDIPSVLIQAIVPSYTTSKYFPRPGYYTHLYLYFLN